MSKISFYNELYKSIDKFNQTNRFQKMTTYINADYPLDTIQSLIEEKSECLKNIKNSNEPDVILKNKCRVMEIKFTLNGWKYGEYK